MCPGVPAALLFCLCAVGSDCVCELLFTLWGHQHLGQTDPAGGGCVCCVFAPVPKMTAHSCLPAGCVCAMDRCFCTRLPSNHTGASPPGTHAGGCCSWMGCKVECLCVCCAGVRSAAKLSATRGLACMCWPLNLLWHCREVGQHFPTVWRGPFCVHHASTLKQEEVPSYPERSHLTQAVHAS